MTGAVLSPADEAWLRSLEHLEDAELGAMVLAAAPTNAGRSPADLLRLSRAAGTFGASLVDHGADERVEVVERTGGLEQGPVLARYRSAGSRVELFTDTVALCEAAIDRAGWRAWFPTGTVRRAAIEHERAHHRILQDRALGLRRALGEPALRIGRWRRWATVVGADEVAAHACAARALGLARSPLLFTAAAMAAVSPAKES